jgi:hypothetical protein
VILPDAAEDVCDFRFSEQNVLYAVSQPEQSPSRTEHKVTVLAWSISDTVRQALPPIYLHHDVSTTMPDTAKRLILLTGQP